MDVPGKRGAKFFGYGTPEKIYNTIKEYYDRKKPLSFYELRDKHKPCNLYVDIDSLTASKESYDENTFLKQVRDDFNRFGITEPWNIQGSCGPKGDKYKVSYHITIPGVEFQTHKHLKQWFKCKCREEKQSNGVDKNGKPKTKIVFSVCF